MKTYIVDSFTTEAFKGNPAGVCLVEQPVSEEKMQLVAKELNLSETAFIHKLGPDHTYAIRYFSPKMEIPLCGHATLASAKVLFETNALDEIHFITIQHLDLVVRKQHTDISMEFPVYGLEQATAPPELLQALGLSHVEHCMFNRETKILLLEIASAAHLAALSPDYNALLRSHDAINGVLVTALANSDSFDFHSRYFWPWSGTNEDPVTGGTHTFLASYWGKKLGKQKMRSFQASERTGYMEVELVSETKLLIKSNAVIILEGHMRNY
jgi:PhzF family phenazine biosynthesis protein